jgi:hypothetical protein
VDPRGSVSRTIEYGVTIGAAMAALIRADMNIDPSSTYPLHATGSWVDNVMNAENKEETVAHKVIHTSIVPLISPIIDINDQVRLAHALVFDPDYYTKAVNRIAEYNYPFNAHDVDYLDWDLLYNRSNVLAASWDEAAKIARIQRSTFPAIGGNLGISPSVIMNANYQTNNDDDLYLLRQADFRDADAYYEHATQRMMAFLDVNEAKAATTKWGSPIPATEAMASDPTRGKRRVLFARHDVFFWKKYPLPGGIENNTALISLDRYANPVCGSPDVATVPGAFGNAVGLVPREWPNKMRLDCSRKPLIDPATIEAATGGKAKLIHYIVAIDPEDAAQAGDLYDFDAATGQYKNYPEVKFVSVFRAKFDVSPAVTRRGGEMVFTFNTAPWAGGIQAAIDAGYITFSADQIAIYRTYVDTAGKLRVRFKRGNMPNEAFGQPSHLQMFLEGSSVGALTATMDIYELQYDVSAPWLDYEDWSVRTVTA